MSGFPRNSELLPWAELHFHRATRSSPPPPASTGDAPQVSCRAPPPAPPSRAHESTPAQFWARTLLSSAPTSLSGRESRSSGFRATNSVLPGCFTLRPRPPRARARSSPPALVVRHPAHPAHPSASARPGLRIGYLPAGRHSAHRRVVKTMRDGSAGAPEPRRSRRGLDLARKSAPRGPRPAHPVRRPLTARAVAVVAQTHNPADAVTMLKRPPTRIELKPEDREEYQQRRSGSPPRPPTTRRRRRPPTRTRASA